MNNLQAVILCGGKGTRLEEVTIDKPKPMVEIGGKPILWHIMKHYSSFGIKKFILALGYKADYIKNHFLNFQITSRDFTLNYNGDNNLKYHNQSLENDWEITFIDTGLENLKGSRIKQLEKYIEGDTFFLTYGDGVSDIDLKKLYDFHQSHNKIATLSAVRPPSRFGRIELNGVSVTSFNEKSQLSEGFINGGFFILNKKIMEKLTTKIECDFEFGPLDELAIEGQLMAYRHEGFWQCMDTKREKEFLEKSWEKGDAKWKIWE